MKAIFASLALSILPAALGAGYNSPPVRALSASDFDKHVPAEKVTVAVFHAPWCGHCKKLEPDYAKAAKNLKGLVNFVSVDCDEEQNKRVCAQFEVKGFPTIKAFPGKMRKHPRDYTGFRTAKAIADYAVDMMPSYVKRLKGASELEAFLAKKPASLLITSASTVTPLYKALSTDFKSKMDFYAIKDAEELGMLKERLGGVTTAPAVIFWEGDGKPAVRHQGSLKYDDLYAFYLKSLREAGRGGSAGKSEL